MVLFDVTKHRGKPKRVENHKTSDHRPATHMQAGFTLIELVLIMIILGLLAAVAYEKWPTGMEEEAAVKEFRHAVRYAQHRAMTRRFSSAATAWGLTVTGNRYTLKRQDADCTVAPDSTDQDRCAESEYQQRALNNSSATGISNGAIHFNAIGEPIDTATGAVLAADTLFVINGVRTVTIAQQTGYVN